MGKKYSNVRGTIDFSREEVLIFEELRKKSIDLFNLYGYRQLILPLLEEKGLFIKSVGQGTDIAQNQMMQVAGKDIVLRPEATAQVVRYYLQERLDKKNGFYKFFYIGPMFRGERPQKGRLRQFNHIGAEVIGSDSFYLDAEVIKLAVCITDAIGVTEKKLQINSLGCKKDKDKLSAFVQKGLAKKKKSLCLSCQKRIEKNPLRVIDCKRSTCRDISASLGLGRQHLCFSCRDHLDNLFGVLNCLGLDYEYDPYLVRGLDYYTNTVFEITSTRLGSQDALGAGGRYNDLFKRLGNLNLPAVGFALGVERIMLILAEHLKSKEQPVIFVAQTGNLEEKVFSLLSDLRKNNIACSCDFRQKSLKAQLRYAQKIESNFVIILGEKEFQKDKVILKRMEVGRQEEVELKSLIPKIKELSGQKK